MSKHKICACGADISDDYMPTPTYDPPGWFCISCDSFFLDEDAEGSEDDEESKQDQ